MAIRRAAKIDDNQNELVALIRAMGVSVAITSAAQTRIDWNMGARAYA